MFFMHNDISVKWYKETATLQNGNKNKNVTIKLLESEDHENHTWEVCLNEDDKITSKEAFNSLTEAYEFGSKLLS